MSKFIGTEILGKTKFIVNVNSISYVERSDLLFVCCRLPIQDRMLLCLYVIQNCLIRSEIIAE